MQNAAVSPEMLSAEENDQAVAAAKETLELAFLLLKSKFINGCIIWYSSMKVYFLCCKISDSICKYLTSFYLFLCSYLLQSEDERPWLDAVESSPFESSEPIFLELHASAMLCLPSGECMLPDATSCTALTSALYSTASEEDVLHRQLKVGSFSSRFSVLPVPA